MIEPRDPTAVAEQLAGSLRATTAGIRQVETSVRASGFAEALPGYRQMRTILLNQRLWTLHMGRRELDPLWHDLAGAAQTVASLLVPFAEVMQAIGRLDDQVAAQHPASSTARPSALLANFLERDPDGDELLKALQAGPLGRRQLRRQLGWSEARLAETLKRLGASGRVKIRPRGRGQQVLVR